MGLRSVRMTWRTVEAMGGCLEPVGRYSWSRRKEYRKYLTTSSVFQSMYIRRIPIPTDPVLIPKLLTYLVDGQVMQVTRVYIVIKTTTRLG